REHAIAKLAEVQLLIEFFNETRSQPETRNIGIFHERVDGDLPFEIRANSDQTRWVDKLFNAFRIT
ncbi:hypothetical protein OFO94_37470, partial [Escherichia coli]|nr:hypothetical protein [Escherichia coli]